MENPSRPDLVACVRLAEQAFGKQRGWHWVAGALGISERLARGIAYGERGGATVCPDRALEVRVQLARLRVAQLRAEIEAIEDTMNDDTALAGAGGRRMATGR